MYRNIQDIIDSAQQPLNIIEEYATLSPKRKVILCDHLFLEGRTTFQNTVKLIWPEATSRDMKKLEKFIFLLKKTRTIH